MIRALKYLTLFTVLIPSTYVVASDQASQVNESVLYTNGVFWTGVDGARDASIMIVSDGEISFIGEQQPIDLKTSRTVDLKGHFVIPGLIDNHTHFIEGGAGLAAVQLRDAKSPEEFSRRITEHAETLSPGQWVLYGNWDHELWGGELPNKAWIDEQTKDTPVFVMRLDGHMGFANSAALKLAGINRSTKQAVGGEIVLDYNGEPTGVLKDTAMNPVFAVLPKPSDEEMLNAINAAQKHALSLGLTKVHVMTANPNEAGIFDDFVLADKQGLLRIRAAVYTPIEYWQQAIESRPSDRYSSQRLSWAGLKGLTDGALGSTTAWFYKPYLDAPDTNGFALIKADDLLTMLKAADAADINLAIHAIGDRAIDNAIESMRSVAGDTVKAERYRIEHFQHPSSKAINMAAQSGIIASMQPYHAIDDGRWAQKRIGAERIKTTYAFKSILDAKGILSFGSDWPVAPLSPLQGIYAAVTRRTIDGANPDGWLPHEKITVEQALKAYTSANAYAGFEENAAGTLEVGKRADFVVLEQDLRKIDPNAIADVAVLMTIIDGKVEFEAVD